MSSRKRTTHKCLPLLNATTFYCAVISLSILALLPEDQLSPFGVWVLGIMRMAPWCIFWFMAVWATVVYYVLIPSYKEWSSAVAIDIDKEIEKILLLEQSEDDWHAETVRSLRILRELVKSASI